MDIVKVVGVGHYDFTDDAHRRVTGWKYHVLRMPTNPDLIGYEAVSYSASETLMQQWKAVNSFIPGVGEVCTVSYNRYGRLDQFGEIPDASELFPEYSHAAG